MRLRERASLGMRLGELASYTAWDRLRRSSPVSTDQVPAHVRQLSAEWLTSALCSDVPGARVLSHRLLGGSSGSTTRDRIELTYNDVGQSAGLPEVVFAKSSPKFTSRVAAGLTDVIQGEGTFYRHLRPMVDMNAPRAYHIALDPKGLRSMYLLEDVGRTRDAMFGGPLTMYVDKAMAESMVTTLAAYHGAFWNHTVLTEVPWLGTPLAMHVKMDEAIGFDKRAMVGIERSRDFVPQEFTARYRELWPALMRALAKNAGAPITLLHSDVHIGNWYCDGRREMGLYDWQCAATGGWALDLSYALGSALTIDDRRDWEADRLALYLDKLAACGGEPPSFETARTEYRLQILHGLVFWLFTIGSGALQPNMQPVEISTENVKRLVQATLDHETLDL